MQGKEAAAAGILFVCGWVALFSHGFLLPLIWICSLFGGGIVMALTRRPRWFPWSAVEEWCFQQMGLQPPPRPKVTVTGGNRLTFFTKNDYEVYCDLEFCGSGPVRNQIMGMGAALLDVKAGKILDSFRIGPIHLSEGRAWEPGCRGWWDSIPEMKALALDIDAKKGTVTFEFAMTLFVSLIQSWIRKYDTLGMPDASESKRLSGSPVPVKRWAWGFDTAINDPAHLAAALNAVTGDRLSHFFGTYRDAMNVDVLEAAAMVASGILSRDELEKRSDFPKNAQPHDPQSDAYHIASRAIYYRTLLSSPSPN
jgi:hypothetical protein